MTPQHSPKHLPSTHRRCDAADGSGNPTWRWRNAAIAMVWAFGSASIAGCAMAGTYNPDNLPMDQVTGIAQTCRSVMGAPPGEERYDNCVESLTDSAQSLNRGRALQADRGDCFENGLRPGDPAFGECELRSADARSGSGAVAIRAARISNSDAQDEPGGAKSYAYASPRDVFRREQLACARLGLDPADVAFSSCVAGLQSSMFEADNPAQ